MPEIIVNGKTVKDAKALKALFDGAKDFSASNKKGLIAFLERSTQRVIVLEDELGAVLTRISPKARDERAIEWQETGIADYETATVSAWIDADTERSCIWGYTSVVPGKIY